MFVRRPAVAGQFYPGDPDSLRHMVASMTPVAQRPEPAIAVISPHAGYVFSGEVAGKVMGAVHVPETVIVLGPNHTGHGARASIMTEGVWDMPLGPVEVDHALADLLLRSVSGLSADVEAHLYEHSLEVQVPFLQYRQPRLKLVPICLGPLSLEECKALGDGLSQAVADYGRPVLLVASTDMSHYVPAETARRLDSMAIEEILRLDPTGLYHTVVENRISMCGYVPTTVTLYGALSLGAKGARLVDYRNSGEVNGDTSRVVGYAGIVVS